MTISKLLAELGNVQLLAVSKQQPIENIQAAIQKGITRFGENYLQEALPKIQALKPDYPALEWHFIGKIQSNKTKAIAHYFDWVHSLDRLKVAAKLNHYRAACQMPLNICIEINDSGSDQKSGITLSQLPEFIAYMHTLPYLHWRGLMTTVTQDYEKTAQAFYDLKKQGYTIDTLSMGMSPDYQHAIALGATLIRLGTRIFGQRRKLP